MDSEGSSGCKVDILLRFWPTLKGMYRLEYENIGTGI